MEKKKIILDVDTGHDDAAAIMFAAGSPAIDIVGITVTAGNQTLEKTLLNTLNLCSELHIKTPVFAGLSKPLLREQITAGDIHGETGFDGPVFSPLKKKADRRRAVEFIISAILDEPGEITLVATGPLTNIAAAVRMEPGITGAVKNIVFMGGSLGRGNITPSAEFNIFADPEAADIVFRSGAPLVMVPLDVTTKVALDDPMLNFLRRNDNSAVSIFAASMEHYTRACLSYSGECPAM
ncbi:MAG: nucleoside hydrolase, partial [Spirochaetaceae bacterium]|nr:nucleoside hydrolase [Spirochaetaceae bacterium]